MAEGILSNAIERLKSALDGLFVEEPSATPLFPTNVPQGQPEPVITISKSGSQPMTSKPETKEPLGKITSFNYKGDPYSDTKSSQGIAAFGKLTNSSMAVSPDIEEAFRKAGINPKDRIQLTLADGSKIERTWDDRTMQDKQAIKTYGKPLRGRFDINIPNYSKPHEKDEMAVIGFQKIAKSE